MAGTIELAAARYPVDPGARWVAGTPLELLFCGYSGTRNTGADLRVEEMLRQTRHLLGDEHVALRILTLDPALSHGYFPTARQVRLPRFFPAFLAGEVHRAHGVVACEGSMFKSKFATALSTLMVGALGLARAEHKPAVGWGGEAGVMDPPLQRLVRRYASDAFVMCRNDASRDLLRDLGVRRTTSGTDTAWSLPDPDPAVGAAALRDAGWNGADPVLHVAVIHPFWWPVKPDLARAAAWAVAGVDDDAHYDAVYFHSSGEEVDRRFAAYVDAIAGAVRRFTARHACFVSLLGMERLDRRACEAVAARLGGAPVFASDAWTHRQMLSILRTGSLLLTSRYHAAVCSMPAGLPSVAVTMDERLRNLFDDRGTPELCLTVDDADLEGKGAAALEAAWAATEELRRRNLETTRRNLVKMGEMGRDFVGYLTERLPGLPVRNGLGADAWSWLPPLDPALLRRLDAA
jgi:polysaccharide pyruvyl transferase WcaK-like protein